MICKLLSLPRLINQRFIKPPEEYLENVIHYHKCIEHPARETLSQENQSKSTIDVITSLQNWGSPRTYIWQRYFSWAQVRGHGIYRCSQGKRMRPSCCATWEMTNNVSQANENIDFYKKLKFEVAYFLAQNLSTTCDISETLIKHRSSMAHRKEQTLA